MTIELLSENTITNGYKAISNGHTYSVSVTKDLDGIKGGVVYVYRDPEGKRVLRPTIHRSLRDVENHYPNLKDITAAIATI